jgi:hypothetical protein
MITVDDQKDVAAFKDYTSPDKAAAPTKEAPPKATIHMNMQIRINNTMHSMHHRSVVWPS